MVLVNRVLMIVLMFIIMAVTLCLRYYKHHCKTGNDSSKLDKILLR